MRSRCCSCEFIPWCEERPPSVYLQCEVWTRNVTGFGIHLTCDLKSNEELLKGWVGWVTSLVDFDSLTVMNSCLFRWYPEWLCIRFLTVFSRTFMICRLHKKQDRDGGNGIIYFYYEIQMLFMWIYSMVWRETPNTQTGREEAVWDEG